MEIYGNNFMPKNAVKYVCNKCNFSCSKESNWNNHNSTQKHKRKCLEIENMPKNAVLCPDHICSYWPSYFTRGLTACYIRYHTPLPLTS